MKITSGYVYECANCKTQIAIKKLPKDGERIECKRCNLFFEVKGMMIGNQLIRQLKGCPDLTVYKQDFSNVGMMNKVSFNNCLKEECVAYENGICKKYNNKVEV